MKIVNIKRLPTHLYVQVCISYLVNLVKMLL